MELSCKKSQIRTVCPQPQTLQQFLADLSDFENDDDGPRRLAITNHTGPRIEFQPCGAAECAFEDEEPPLVSQEELFVIHEGHTE